MWNFSILLNECSLGKKLFMIIEILCKSSGSINLGQSICIYVNQWFYKLMCHLVRYSNVHRHALLLHVIKVGLGDGYAEVDDRGVLYRRFRFVGRFTGCVTVGFLCWRHVHSLLAVRAGHQKSGDGLSRQKCVCFCNLITERNTSCL